MWYIYYNESVVPGFYDETSSRFYVDKIMIDYCVKYEFEYFDKTKEYTEDEM